MAAEIVYVVLTEANDSVNHGLSFFLFNLGCVARSFRLRYECKEDGLRSGRGKIYQGRESLGMFYPCCTVTVAVPSVQRMKRLVPIEMQC